LKLTSPTFASSSIGDKSYLDSMKKFISRNKKTNNERKLNATKDLKILESKAMFIVKYPIILKWLF
tara:strand:- start:806 stop:1003 length:198 start_codon:yes stop_codon:yes gene_type:complete